MVKVAIMGHGTVGSGVYEVFEMNAEKIARTVGEPVEGVFVVQTSKIPTAEMDAAAEKLNAVGKVCAAMRIL